MLNKKRTNSETKTPLQSLIRAKGVTPNQFEEGLEEELGSHRNLQLKVLTRIYKEKRATNGFINDSEKEECQKIISAIKTLPLCKDKVYQELDWDSKNPKKINHWSMEDFARLNKALPQAIDNAITIANDKTRTQEYNHTKDNPTVASYISALAQNVHAPSTYFITAAQKFLDQAIENSPEQLKPEDGDVCRQFFDKIMEGDNHTSNLTLNELDSMDKFPYPLMKRALGIAKEYYNQQIKGTPSRGL